MTTDERLKELVDGLATGEVSPAEFDVEVARVIDQVGDEAKHAAAAEQSPDLDRTLALVRAL